MKAYASSLCGIILVIAVISPVTKHHGGQIVILPRPCTELIIYRWCQPSGQDGFAPTKFLLQAEGITCQWISHTNSLIYHPSQLQMYTCNLTQMGMLSIPKLSFNSACGAPLPCMIATVISGLPLGCDNVYSNSLGRCGQSSCSFMPCCL